MNNYRPRPSIFARLSQWMNRFSPKVYPKTYTVEVYLNHPRVKNRIASVLVNIDAHNKDHARRQLEREITMTVGKAVLTSKLQA